MSIKVIVFNGPPRSGKDTSTNFALEMLGEAGDFYRLAEPLKNATHALFGVPDATTEMFDSVKGEPNSIFLGSTPRQAYIDMSESMVKPFYGKDFFAKIAVNKINYLAEYSDREVIIICDCGFDVEVEKLVEAYGAENIALVHLYRPGCTYEGDSRDYVRTDSCKNYRIDNDGTLEELDQKIKELIEDFINASQ